MLKEVTINIDPHVQQHNFIQLDVFRSYDHFFFPMARQPYMGLGLLVSSRFHDHTQLRHTTLGRTPLDE
jgi:hypothetical protein